MPNWKPVLGATYTSDHVDFRVWAPDANSMEVVIGAGPRVAMKKLHDGYFTAMLTGLHPGNSYSFYIDGRGAFPDPASRYQAEGVHGPSVIVDPASYEWHDSDWRGFALQDAIFYELHIGAFTPEGTYRAAAAKLNYLRELGINAIELMPLSDFSGDRNWGYDGVAPFAPARCYGTPNDLRYFVDQAHQLGMAVFLDVIYNHFGPDGAYQSTFSKHYFTNHHHTPWGNAINFDADLNQPVREYVVESALRWIHEYHFDGLRLDATHEFKDDSPRHILAELSSHGIHLIAEDGRNLAELVRPEAMNLSGVWSDDFHHQMRRLLAGDHDGYYSHFDGTVASLAKLIQRGWMRGHSDTTGIPYHQFVFFIQNHDQIGNRAFGDRLNHNIDAAAYRAASALLLLLPQTPLLFMGQEWAASTPFLYFTDHHNELGRAVTEGRRREFAGFTSFSHPEIPDPQSPETFLRSKLNWHELQEAPHASVLRLYKSLIRLRRHEPSISAPRLQIEALDTGTLLLKRAHFTAVIRLIGHGDVHLPSNAAPLIWNSEDPSFAPDSQPILIGKTQISFARPGAVVFEVRS